MHILAIETSCDETAASVLKNGSEILSNVVATQTEFHKKYGGIVPEIAARKHVELISPVIQEAIDKANIPFDKLDAVAVTYGPGLIGSLIVGLCAAKALAWSIKKPLIGVNHLEGHIYANLLTSNFQHPASKLASSPKSSFPFLCLLVSGGHTMIVHVKNHGKYETIGRTRDDAAGEAFDKVARVLNLGYPGGPIIDRLAKEGNPLSVKFKKPMVEDQYGYDFSFSGIKTAVVNYVTRTAKRASFPTSQSLDAHHIRDICSSFQNTVIVTLVEKLIQAARDLHINTVSLAGGVSANSQLREYLTIRCAEEGLSCLIPSFEFSTDNAAMIACAAYYKFQRKEFSALRLKPLASLKL
ncbi:tRNA (adenosine(37)-N6)-threonylcarbamoyltransferase complex transferase subunit TsaD [Candidatus Saganbacteria bacterium]|nr:tRNA (adenosine(37)-N6)-threonylcarbamoyltransferase complex transferase subunit TsaD [Candidatus Saganbacteria bacterium]